MVERPPRKTILNQAIVHELLLYDPFIGSLMWRPRPRHWFKSDHDWKCWNTKHAGNPAFNNADNHGYLFGRVLGEDYKAHRIIWLMQTGRWPNPQVDHKNHNRADNRWINLREATNRENGRNQTLRRSNTSGRVGVYCENGKWRAQISFDGRHRFLGTFPTFEAAVAGREQAERQYGFHPNHGRILRRRLRLRELGVAA